MWLQFIRVGEVLFELIATCFGTADDRHIVGIILWGKTAVFSFKKLELYCLFWNMINHIWTKCQYSIHHSLFLFFSYNVGSAFIIYAFFIPISMPISHSLVQVAPFFFSLLIQDQLTIFTVIICLKKPKTYIEFFPVV